MSNAGSYIQCGLCGHRHPKEHARARGYISCACGMRLEIGTVPGRKPRGVLGLAVIGSVIAAAIGGAAYLWARGLG